MLAPTRWYLREGISALIHGRSLQGGALEASSRRVVKYEWVLDISRWRKSSMMSCGAHVGFAWAAADEANDISGLRKPDSQCLNSIE
jgi:hypothetical protein